MNNFKYTKSIYHKGVNFKTFKYGTWAFQNITYGSLSIKHITFIKNYLQKNIKKFKQYKFNITLNKISTKKPLDTRMGGGKGIIYDKQYFLKPGFIFLEFYNISSEVIFSMYKRIFTKIPIKVRLIKY